MFLLVSIQGTAVEYVAPTRSPQSHKLNTAVISTCIFSSHRLNSSRFCDRIWVHRQSVNSKAYKKAILQA